MFGIVLIIYGFILVKISSKKSKSEKVLEQVEKSVTVFCGRILMGCIACNATSIYFFLVL